MRLVWVVDFGEGVYGLFVVIQNILYAVIFLYRIPKKKINPQKYIDRRYDTYKVSFTSRFGALLRKTLNEAKTVEEAERIVREFEWRKIIYFYSR